MNCEYSESTEIIKYTRHMMNMLIKMDEKIISLERRIAKLEEKRPCSCNTDAQSDKNSKKQPDNQVNKKQSDKINYMDYMNKSKLHNKVDNDDIENIGFVYFITL